MTRSRRDVGYFSRNVMLGDLPATAKALYGILCCYADVDGVCFPSNETLANVLGVGSTTLERNLVVLREAGVIVREPRFKDGRQTTSITRLIDIQTVEYTGGRVPADGDPGDPAGGDQKKHTTRNTGRLRRTRTTKDLVR